MKDFFDAMATYEKSNLREIYPLDCEDSPSGGWPIPPGGKFQWTMESTGFHFPASCIEDGSCGGTYRLGSIRISVPVNSTRLYEWGYSITGYNAWIVEFTNVPQEGSFAAEISIGDQGLGVMNWTIPAGNSQLDLSDLLLNNENIINFIGMNVKALPGGNVIVTAYSQTNGQFQPLIDADHLEFLTDWEKGPEFLELEIQRDTAVDSIGQVAIFYDRDEIRKNGLDPLFFKLNVLQKDSTLKYSRGHRIELRAKNETGISFFRPKNFTRRYPGQPNSDWIPLGEDVTCKENATYWMLLAKPNAPSIIDVELFIDGSKMSFLANKGKKRMVVDSLKIKTK